MSWANCSFVENGWVEGCASATQKWADCSFVESGWVEGCGAGESPPRWAECGWYADGWISGQPCGTVIVKTGGSQARHNVFAPPPPNIYDDQIKRNNDILMMFAVSFVESQRWQ